MTKKRFFIIFVIAVIFIIAGIYAENVDLKRKPLGFQKTSCEFKMFQLSENYPSLYKCENCISYSPLYEGAKPLTAISDFSFLVKPGETFIVADKDTTAAEFRGCIAEIYPELAQEYFVYHMYEKTSTSQEVIDFLKAYDVEINQVEVSSSSLRLDPQNLTWQFGNYTFTLNGNIQEYVNITMKLINSFEGEIVNI